MGRLRDYIDKRGKRTRKWMAGVRAGAEAEAEDAVREIWCRGDPVLAQAVELGLMATSEGKVV
jgi:hypothetical protein